MLKKHQCRVNSLVSGIVDTSSENGRSDPVTLLQSTDLGFTTVQQDLGTFLDGFGDETRDPLLGRWGDDWSADSK